MPDRVLYHLNGYRFTDEFMVSDRISEECIIGAGTMQKWHFKLDFENEKIIIDPRVTKLDYLIIKNLSKLTWFTNTGY